MKHYKKRLGAGNRIKFNLHRPAAFLTILLITAVVAGCFGNFAHFKKSRDVTSIFENGQVLPDHRYYVGGPRAKPNAVVAIHKDFTLSPGVWREVTVDQESLAALIARVGFVIGAEEKSRRIPNGARIISPDGKQVGVWYSVFEHSTVRMEEGSDTLWLSAPPSTLPRGITSEGLRS
jgi:hypothetical protein